MNKKITDAEIDLLEVRDQFVGKVRKLNRLISDYDALVCGNTVNIEHRKNAGESFEDLQVELEKNRQAGRQLRRLRLDTEADINQIVIDLNRLAAERKSA